MLDCTSNCSSVCVWGGAWVGSSELTNHKKMLLMAWSFPYSQPGIISRAYSRQERKGWGWCKGEVSLAFVLKKLSCGLSLSFCCLLLGNKATLRGERFWKGEYCFCLRQSLGAVVRNERMGLEPVGSHNPFIAQTLIYIIHSSVQWKYVAQNHFSQASWN